MHCAAARAALDSCPATSAGTGAAPALAAVHTVTQQQARHISEQTCCWLVAVMRSLDSPNARNGNTTVLAISCSRAALPLSPAAPSQAACVACSNRAAGHTSRARPSTGFEGTGTVPRSRRPGRPQPASSRTCAPSSHVNTRVTRQQVACSELLDGCRFDVTVHMLDHCPNGGMVWCGALLTCISITAVTTRSTPCTTASACTPEQMSAP